jgi:hypothetical protein
MGEALDRNGYKNNTFIYIGGYVEDDMDLFFDVTIRGDNHRPSYYYKYLELKLSLSQKQFVDSIHKYPWIKNMIKPNNECFCGQSIVKHYFIVDLDNQIVLTLGSCCVLVYAKEYSNTTDFKKRTCVICNKPHKRIKFVICRKCEVEIESVYKDECIGRKQIYSDAHIEYLTYEFDPDVVVKGRGVQFVPRQNVYISKQFIPELKMKPITFFNEHIHPLRKEDMPADMGIVLGGKYTGATYKEVSRDKIYMSWVLQAITRSGAMMDLKYYYINKFLII